MTGHELMVRPEKVVSGYLYTLGILAALTAISPLFIFSWPYLAIAGYPTVRWARRSKSPVPRPVKIWIVVVAALMAATPFVTLILYVLDGYSGPENWWLLGMSALFAVFMVAAVRCLTTTSDATTDVELGSS
jgi:hypothetical protein